MFESIPAAPIEPILGMLEIFRADYRPYKINLGIGVYKDETGNTPVLASVKKAEALLLDEETSKNYLSIEGIETFANYTQRLLFGENSTVVSNKLTRCAQTPGGTSALRVAAEFLFKNTTVRRIWISNPSWPNHKNIFQAAGLDVYEYTYYDTTNHVIDFNGMLASLNQAQTGDVVLFHGCCHNPSGMDFSSEQWRELAYLTIQNGWLPLFDFSYQGFAYGLEEDAKGLKIFSRAPRELIICSSYSKMFSLYNERVGACTIVATENNIVDRAFSQLKLIIRANYSNPPAHGAAVVATILDDDVLRTIWEQELKHMRARMQRMRLLLVNTLQEKNAQQDFSFINQQHGMFSLSGLNQNQVLKLRYQFGVYLVDSGRINVASITLDNINQLCEAIIAVL
ncbi:amino acid aminotransferase [Candidatus Palibaumannia cicadellinicola]|uniref:Aminotransferase n=1 Tax=Candidatus Palibaumannia cicadellinicola TaxID=186490 RepID=A0A088MYI0_9GAMM|nr:amino acid aminotransferase [Candidatus Baumannia cicadellinicola]AIN47327.1 Biosynthetic Aromatic amino acid aminotransferase alpha [Candidatus Baumannia cicadellinicola]